MTEDQEFLAIAVIRPFEGREEELLDVLKEFYVVMERKGYSHDKLFREATYSPRLFNFRYWTSKQARRDAYEDFEVHRYWQKLSEICEVEKIYEELNEIKNEGLSALANHSRS